MDKMKTTHETLQAMEKEIQTQTTEIRTIKNDVKDLSSDVHELSTEVKLIKNDLTQYNKILDKIDSLTTGIEKIVIIHNEKLTASDCNYNRLGDRLNKYQDQIEKNEKDLEDKITKLEKFKWTLLGIFTGVSTVVTTIMTLLIQFIIK